ncbi:hypothetical protein LEP1GSC040_0665 [Leptospira santarosai str. 2000030832]|nr:hypothetical protein LEP1GSC040_0665 [Leptospira santarosai str. 2000030832]
MISIELRLYIEKSKTRIPASNSNVSSVQYKHSDFDSTLKKSLNLSFL